MATTKFNLPDFKAAVDRAINAGVTAAATQASVQMRGMLGKGGRLQSAAAGRPPNSQRGGLSRSLTATKAVNRRARAGTNLVYGRILETGGTIHAKRTRFLPIPLNYAAKRMLEKSTGSLRTKGPMRVMRTTTGKLFLIGVDKVRGSVTRGAKGSLRFNHEPVFMLKRSVTIKSHPYIRPGVFGPGKKSPIMRAAVAVASKSLGKYGRSVTGGVLA